MITVLQFLEPVMYTAGSYIFSELDDVNEVVFIESGMYDVGYEINKKVILKLRCPARTVIGGFEVCFDKRILFIFKAFTDCKGYIIRKKNFRSLEAKFPHLYHSLKMKQLFDYIHKIRRPVLAYKTIDIDFYDRRADYK
jgi:CRP-like cAMP-binding protein